MAEERSSSYICAEDISVGYHNLPLIQKINLHVNRGEILTCLLYTSRPVMQIYNIRVICKGNYQIRNCGTDIADHNTTDDKNRDVYKRQGYGSLSLFQKSVLYG